MEPWTKSYSRKLDSLFPKSENQPAPPLQKTNKTSMEYKADLSILFINVHLL